MKNALIDPNAPVSHIVSWNSSTPVYEKYANSARVAQVSTNTFPVATPLFWQECSDEIVADGWYYDTIALTFNPVVNEPKPT